MREFHVRAFFNTPVEKWPCSKLERFICVFDDGVKLEVTTPRMDISSKFWELLTKFDRLPITSKHYIGKGALPWSKMSDILSDIYKSLFDHYDESEFDREKVWYDIYRNVNNVYNDSIVRFKEWTRSVNSFDFAELYNHPRMAEIRNELRPNPNSIEEAHKAAAEFLMNDKTLSLNPVISDAKTSISKMEQLVQVLVCRGYNTDIDDFIFSRPIMSNYYAGIHDAAESVIDSTLAAKAYIYQGGPLERTQYGNRKLQFSSMGVDLLIHGDCGSTTYAPITVTKERRKALLGLFFLGKDGKLVETTDSNVNDMVGMTMQFRVPMFCGYRNGHSVCKTCYGTLARNVPYGTNIGFIASVNTQSEVSQRVLKVKHVESLTNHEPIVLSREEKEFILNDRDSSKLRLNPKLLKEGTRIIIKGDAKDKIINGSRLPVLTMADLNPQQSMARHSQFREMIFEIKKPDGKSDRRKVTVSKGSMSSFFTADFLRWFVGRQFRVESDGSYRIDLEGWDFEKAFLELPKKHMSMKDFSAEVEVFIRSSSDDSSKHLGKLKQLSQYHDPTQAMLDLYDLISSRVGVHMTHVSVMCLSMMIDPDDKVGRRIPPLNKPARFARYSRILNEGSWGALAAYQGGQVELCKPEQYMNVNREPHLMDPMFMP